MFNIQGRNASHQVSTLQVKQEPGVETTIYLRFKRDEDATQRHLKILLAMGREFTAILSEHMTGK